MPLEPYERNGVWWVRGRVDFNGRPITGYIRRSTGASEKAGAEDWIRQTEESAIRRHLLGDAHGLTFDEAVVLYDAKPAEARYLLKILPHLTGQPLGRITPRQVRNLGPAIYPMASTDTWRRQIIAPVSAVINNAHELGRGPAIRIRGYTTKERIDQDQKRGRQSRRPRRAADAAWVRAFCGAADPYNAALVQFMFETGARVGQAVALLPRDLDLQNARVRLKAQKGHPEQWVRISIDMVVTLANLPPKRPHNRRGGRKLPARVFGYASHSGMLTAWKTICGRAGIPYLTPHEAGRHGYYTELRVRQGLDPVTVAAGGRWAHHALPDQAYAHAHEGKTEADLRDRIRTSLVQTARPKPAKRLKSGKSREQR